jgi:hypothetical protein
MGTVQAPSVRDRTPGSGKTSVPGLECIWNCRGVLFRWALVALFVVGAHQTRWEWLRFVTSEIVLRLSSYLDIRTTRISFDVIELQGEKFRYLTSCTFVDVFIASIPLIWDVKASLIRNGATVSIAGIALFNFNAIRLEIAVLLYFHRIPWTVADGLLGGLSYFIVWLVIWHTRSWSLDIPTKRLSLS